ncbi:hypothetical protein PENNAL_c0126G11276 [Penicillium nalgiovense]|uniref:Uncharacterized protein n=1 Tax=Penicillium nalgiovense TaxID=60175 RepID=A0A1V6X442_PENNA|nr:hypothetical protein PENNAL_c0126G11276 [Penicillium nalgiovense]
MGPVTFHSSNYQTMSATAVVSQLRGLLEKANSLMPKISKIYPSEEQWAALGDISKSLKTTATRLENKIRESKESRAERAWKESEKLRSHALACKGELLTNGRLKQQPVFRRNIATIFEGPKDSKFDSEEVKVRKALTRQRCEQIRHLSPSGIISWAMAYAPSLWAAGSMSMDVFSCLLDDIEPDQHPPWPSIVGETLHKLLDDEEFLSASLEYREFMKAYDCLPDVCLDRRRKRRRLDHGHNEGMTQGQISPLDEKREMKHMYTNPDPVCIDKLPEPFQTAVRESRLWKWERSQGMKTTSSLATLFPKDNTQDVSLTIWCGNHEAYHLHDVFGLQLAHSS